MTKKIILGIAVVSLATACSQDAVLEENVKDNTIRVSVDVPANTRASESYCPEVLPETFYISAIHVSGDSKGKIYFQDDEVGKTEIQGSHSTNYVFKNGVQYWPESDLDFYAWTSTQNGIELTLDATNGIAKFNKFTVNPIVANQADLLYAKKINYLKGRSGQVDLRFKHALSQVIFNVEVENPNIEVSVKAVGLCNLYGSGIFSWDGYTSETRKPDDNVMQAPAGNKSYGYKWEIDESTKANSEYLVKLDEIIVANYTSGKQVLTAAPKTHTTNSSWDQVMQLIPQKYLESPESASDVPVPALSGAPYIKLQCDIKTTNADGSEVPLYSSKVGDEDKFVYIPFNNMDMIWEPGKRYVYTIKFTKDGKGGQDSPGGDTVLKKITITGEVEEVEEQQEQSVSENIADMVLL